MFTNFQSELISKLNSRNSSEYYTFEKRFVAVLDKHATKKRKLLGGNYKPHINKTLRSVIMKPSQLKNKAMKSKSKNNVIDNKKQGNKDELNKRCKQKFFDNLETKNNSKSFCSKCNPYFSNKHAKDDVIVLLIENNKILLDNRKVANVYFQSITKNLNLFERSDEPTFNIFDEIDIVVNKFCSHPSIV